MKKPKKSFIILGVVISIVLILTYLISPKSGTLDDLAFKNISKESINEVVIFKTGNMRNETSIKDTEKINDIISRFSNLNVSEYRKAVPISYKNQYMIVFDAKVNTPVLMFLYDNGYIEMRLSDQGKTRTYKITDTFDIAYIESLIS
ncbi:hypothetical protein [Clostridium cellulovorans]|uniref:Uncharacterized protein n=1 Tax=Clostridium cellulovorans (strain ATCC 35296 / DSM 3052 / OCM 3 / 743B) TaxID=573061 RepID=D9STV4_CLOC7|nr:hypothetical protein [Clostridium cellulovorans]ADL50792.1 hypothetical protein Clocel_1030 [Clostridium cellulovorans 743B]